MSEFIEPFLCDLEKYLSKEEQGNLLKPWTINQTREQVVEKWQKTHTSDPNELKIKFVGEIDPKEYFGKKTPISVQKELFDNIDGVITYYRLDSSGKVIRDLNNLPIIYNINKE